MWGPVLKYRDFAIYFNYLYIYCIQQISQFQVQREVIHILEREKCAHGLKDINNVVNIAGSSRDWISDLENQIRCKGQERLAI